MKYIKYISTTVGKIGIIEEDGKIVQVAIGKESIQNDVMQKDTKVLLEATKQLTQYFEGKRKEFNLPINLKGTEFMKKVWNELEKIPYGKTMTYGEIARILADRRGIDRMAAQAVGQAVGKNPVCILVPCHRVLGQCQRLTGYAGGLERKKALLTLEGAEFLPDSN